MGGRGGQARRVILVSAQEHSFPQSCTDAERFSPIEIDSELVRFSIEQVLCPEKRAPLLAWRAPNDSRGESCPEEPRGRLK
eukprot:scaffold147031_cov25-Tisochrysis_lutea.AAC.1